MKTIKTINDFAMMEPMKYYNNEDENNQKRQDILLNKDNLYIATEKHDGDWGMFIHYSKGKNLVRSRSISKVTGVYGDYTAKVPHLVEEMDNWPDNTVVLAELCFKEYGTNANTVGTILRCLPPKAIERQKTTPLYAYIFDVLMYNGEDLTNKPYLERIYWEYNYRFEEEYFFRRTELFYDNFAEHADEIIVAGGEGIVIQKKSNPYMSGTRTAWATLKMKQSLPHMELKVIGFIEPNKFYEGDFSPIWKYKLEDGTLVTKPYFYGWKVGVIVDYNGVAVRVTSGATDEDMEWLASNEAAEKLAAGEIFAEVKAMSENEKASLRHPVLVKLRVVEDGVNDK